ncbi:MAG TPA: nucleotidyltransferase family protein [Syntrophomonadaceae bacterium]|nr:nucleotidyltransferase family protein [Syntrophomonadaceae bacterium]HHW29822.1 nucleotidyltransferase family protein [Syntrophomonadaceae bacterium]
MVSAVVLAAGQSQRMGRPKQLLKLGNKTLLEHVVDKMLQTDVGELIVVVGAYRQRIEEILANYRVKCVFNEHYNCGQGTSVAAGAAAVDDQASGILYAVSDQPFLSPAFINKMISKFEEAKPLILKPEVGMPAIFNISLRSELIALTGEAGGRQLMEKYRDRVMIMPGCPEIMTIDVDTEEDYLRIKVLWEQQMGDHA